jgi:hypothetical protein
MMQHFNIKGKGSVWEEINGGMFLVYWTPDEIGPGFPGPGYAHADEAVKKYMPSIAVYSSPWWRTHESATVPLAFWLRRMRRLVYSLDRSP